MTGISKRLIMILTVLALASAAPAAPVGGTVSGNVKDATGKPQMGAVIEVFTSAATTSAKAYTDGKGYYSVSGLIPGTYYVKATATQFLPSMRENVVLQPGSNVLVNLTLNTLVEAFQLLPPRRISEANDDDWRWTLRSAANRPILRVLEDDSPLIVVSRSEDGSDRALKARVAFIAGSDGESFSTSDVKTAFTVEQSMFGSGTMSFNGNLGYNTGLASGILRATYKHRLPTGNAPEFSVTAHRFATPDTVLRHAALNALALTMSDTVNLTDFLELRVGGELQSVQFRGRVNAFRPFGSLTAHLSDNVVLAYDYATSQPTTRASKGFDSSPVDLTEANPHVSLRGSLPQLERARHHEVSLSRRMGKSNFQLAYFNDRMINPALAGVGEIDDAFSNGVDLLPDLYSDTFTYTGGDFQTHGMRAVAQRRFSEAFTATLNYSFGGTLVAEPDILLASATPELFRTEQRHSMTAKFSGMLPKSKTKWISSYKWTSGRNALVPIDLFNRSAGQSDPYLNIFIRQPLPDTSFMPGKMEALVDVRNLLSEGYVPMVGRDGRTLYLVQSPRAMRAGVAFNF